MSKSYRKFYTFLSQKWHFDQIYGEFVTHRAMNFGYQTSFKLLDKGCIEVFFPTGVSLNMWSLTGSMSNLHSGYLYHYSFVMMAALLFLISLFLMISYTFIWAKAELILLVLSYIFLTFLF
jgi:NADH-quinone oxidoreductase subunit L